MAARKQNDEAGQLVEAPNGKKPSARTTSATRTSVATPRLSRGPVDAPGKRHRQPAPDEPVDMRMGEVRGKHTGQKSVKNAPR
jgi:hypothetical protein